MPPYALPSGAVISGLKSDSTKGGGGFNEYVMDDTKGNELIPSTANTTRTRRSSTTCANTCSTRVFEM
jgi:uncharacterized protein involved in type VI secretion and phage assembly